MHSMHEHIKAHVYSKQNHFCAFLCLAQQIKIQNDKTKDGCGNYMMGNISIFRIFNVGYAFFPNYLMPSYK